MKLTKPDAGKGNRGVRGSSAVLYAGEGALEQRVLTKWVPLATALALAVLRCGSETKAPPVWHEHQTGAVGRYPCLCCGYLTMVEPPGSFDICPICFWEDDYVQAKNPYYRGGANSESLIEAQVNFQTFGASNKGLVPHVRKPTPADVRDVGWRSFDPNLDDPLRELSGAVSEMSSPYHWVRLDDPGLLYWWRPTYWWKNPAAHEPRRPQLVGAIGGYLSTIVDAIGVRPEDSQGYDPYMKRAHSWIEIAQKAQSLRDLTAKVLDESDHFHQHPPPGPQATRVMEAYQRLAAFVHQYSDESKEQ